MKAFRLSSLSAVAVFALVSPAAATGETATATIKLADGSEAGTVTLTEATSGVLIKFELKGLPPGPHAVHVHEGGACDGDFTGAGGIYNPLGAKHGFLHDEGPMAGDLPNIHADASGNVLSEVLSPFLTLSKEAEDTLQRLALEVLQRHVVLLLGAPDLDRPNDVRVLEADAKVRLVEEHLPVLLLARVLGQQRLHREELLASFAVVGAREVDDSHAAASDFGDQTEAADLMQAWNRGGRSRQLSHERPTAPEGIEA